MRPGLRRAAHRQRTQSTVPKTRSLKPSTQIVTGTLSAEEFTDFFSARLENGEEPDSLMALFAAIDKDNSGGIDRTEFREGSHLLHSLTCYSSDKHRI